MKLFAADNSSIVRIETGAAVGPIQLWVPEAVSSNTGNSAVYPVGDWRGDQVKLEQHISRSNAIGPGNCPMADEKTFECCGIQFPVDAPVEWRSTVSAHDMAVEFSIELTNLGPQTLKKAGAAVCVKFLEASWWSDESTYAYSSGALTSLATLGRDAGQPNAFQAYLLDAESYDHCFFKEFWGFNERRLDKPVMLSEHRAEGVCCVVRADAAYFLHSNAGNPCTDIMLAFGDIAPRASARARGSVQIRNGRAADLVL